MRLHEAWVLGQRISIDEMGEAKMNSQSAKKRIVEIVGFDPDYEFDETIAQVEVWYNYEVKIWTILFENANGDQIGGADYAHLKSQAIKTAVADGKGTPIHVTDRTTGKVRTMKKELMEKVPSFGEKQK
jgi:hypothetical protein